MAVPGQPPIPALTQWLRDNRRGSMKLWELADKLTAAGYRNRDGEPVTETTLRGWEAPSGGVPQTAVPYLERIFQRRSPGWEGAVADQSAVVAAIDRLGDRVERLTTALELAFGLLDAKAAERAISLSKELAQIADAVAQSRTLPEQPLRPDTPQSETAHPASAGTK